MAHSAEAVGFRAAMQKIEGFKVQMLSTWLNACLPSSSECLWAGLMHSPNAAHAIMFWFLRFIKQLWCNVCSESN